MLTQGEKDYLYSKLEYKKKKTCTEQENDVYKVLKGEIELTDDLFIKVLNSLEYSFKKKLKEGTMKNTLFLSIQEKLPKSWIGVKYSSLTAAKKRTERKPTKNSTKKDIIEYLKKKNIDFDEKSKKSELLDLFENNNILTYKGFNKLS